MIITNTWSAVQSVADCRRAKQSREKWGCAICANPSSSFWDISWISNNFNLLVGQLLSMNRIPGEPASICEVDWTLQADVTKWNPILHIVLADTLSASSPCDPHSSTHTIRCLLGTSSPSFSASPSLSFLIRHTQADTTNTIEYRLAMPTDKRITISAALPAVLLPSHRPNSTSKAGCTVRTGKLVEAIQVEYCILYVLTCVEEKLDEILLV